MGDRSTSGKMETNLARDTLRVTMVMNHPSVSSVYTVSLANVSDVKYHKNHISCNFTDSRRFVRRLKEQGFGNDFGKLLSDTVPLMIQESLIREDGGMLILPFAYTFYASIVECYNELKQNFKIDFVSSDRNILCTVTNNITDSDVWEQLGNKDQFQEIFIALLCRKRLFDRIRLMVVLFRMI